LSSALEQVAGRRKDKSASD
jgi:hypothetical protein